MGRCPRIDRALAPLDANGLVRTEWVRVENLRVMARSTVFQYKGLDQDPIAIGNALNVRAVLLGRVLYRGDQLVIKTELVNSGDGSQLRTTPKASRHREGEGGRRTNN